MNVQQLNVQHTTGEQLREIVAEAEAICNEQDYVGPLRVAMMPVLVEILSEKSVHFLMPQPGPLPLLGLPNGHRS